MNILLFDTGNNRNELNEPIGIETLASFLENNLSLNSHSIDVLWYCKDRMNFDTKKYDIIGISLNIGTLQILHNLLNKLKEENLSPIIVVGNVWATYGYDYLLSLYPHIICVLGEGEEAILCIVKAFYNVERFNFELKKINNLAFISEGSLYLTERSVLDLKKYSPPKRVFNDFLIKNKGIARIERSRGCSWNKCSFCSVNHKYNGQNWRSIDNDVVVRQLIELSQSGLYSIYFTDEDFLGSNTIYSLKLIRSIKRAQKLNLISNKMNFFISIKPIDVINKENYSILKEFSCCGLREVFVGIESGSNSQLRRYGKCTNVETNTKALSKLKLLSVIVDVGFMFFDINMNMEEVNENIKFIEDNELYNYGANIIKKMRVHSFSEVYYKNINNSIKFIPSDLSYHYNFDNKIVEQIYLDYNALDANSYAEKIQTFSRGEVYSEDYRNFLLKKLAQIRKIQFSMLKEIFNYYNNDVNPKLHYYKLSELEHICKETYDNVIVENNKQN